MPYFTPYFDPTMIILLPALIISFWAQHKIQSSYTTYSRVYSRNGYTGSQVARMILDSYGLFNIPVMITSGKLSDHYDPAKKVVKLSNDVYNGTSLASIGIAAHEIGHAIQHKEEYIPIKIRGSLVPVVNIGTKASWILFFIGIVMSNTLFINLGIIFFSTAVLFQLVTLPVEFNASNRAIAILGARNILYEDELKGAKKVLGAAALTYVAAAITAIAQLLRLIAIKNRNDG